MENKENVIELHKNDIKVGEQKLKKLPPNSNGWWTVKEKLKMYHIAYSQALNLAIESREKITDFDGIATKPGLQNTVSADHLYFYKLLTEPYRLHRDQFKDGTKKSKEDDSVANIDDEIRWEAFKHEEQ